MGWKAESKLSYKFRTFSNTQPKEGSALPIVMADEDESCGNSCYIILGAGIGGEVCVFEYSKKGASRLFVPIDSNVGLAPK